MKNKMSYINYYNYSFIIFSIILMLQSISCSQRKLQYYNDNDFPLKYRLNDGNYIVIFSKAMYLYDKDFVQKSTIKTFDNQMFTSYENAYPTNIAQFSSKDGGYIICLVRSDLYIISKDGTYLTTFSSVNNIQYSNKAYHPILPYDHSGNDYYFILLSKPSNNIVYQKYKYNSVDNSVTHIEDKYYNTGTSEYDCLSCELMYLSNDKYIVCFYADWYHSYFRVFDLDNFQSISGKEKSNNDGYQVVKSNINTRERTKTAFCVMRESNLKCSTYDITTDTLTDYHTITDYGCDCQIIDVIIEYFPEREEFVFCCFSARGMYLGRLDKYGNYETMSNQIQIVSDSCNQPQRFNLLYSSTDQKYFILTDTNNCDTKITINSINAPKINDYPIDLVCDHFYNYDKSGCYDTVPNGYYCNDEVAKTIDKCHDNCETCQIGPTTDNNNCLTCKDSKNLDLGNCVDTCTNGHFSDSDGINRCKCSIIKCEFCSNESKQYNLCLSCNNEGDYYPKIDDETRSDSFIDCYNKETVSGYYLNANTGYLEKCYSTCEKCSGSGDENNNKCTLCITTHEFKNDFENDYNCYQICNNYYYFDSSRQHHCTDSCTGTYSKLIESKNKCVDDCSKYADYKYEDNNKCVSTCLPKYYDYNQLTCIDTIPTGYYCNNTSAKTIDKCHDNCATCQIGPTTDNNNCLTCKDSKNLDLGNCVDTCTNGNFLDSDGIYKCKCSNIKCKYCSNESKQYGLCVSCNTEDGYYPKNDDESRSDLFIDCYNKDTTSGYYLNTNTGYLEKCYETCEKCSDIGDENNNKCTACISTREFKTDYENDYNCYEKCNNYYYFDSSRQHHCTDSCTGTYSKLIESKNKCVDDCSKYADYKYEDNNKCVSTCLPKYYDYNQLTCIDTIPTGYYCNNTSAKTIDKCHDNCATCQIGPTTDNNNCLTCKDSKNLDLGNCVDTCTNGNFLDSDGIYKCKCSYIKCKFCSSESTQYNLCVSCNNEGGYYPKNDDEERSDSFIECYNDETIPEEYTLNLESKYYEKCYETCETCFGFGDANNNKCTRCKSTREFKTDFENDSNCYEICSNYYYFDSSKQHHCTDSCTGTYSKLIEPLNKCVDDCSKYADYKYEDNNKCVSTCLPKYYDYNQLTCIDTIPTGYYCNNTSAKTIDKCHDNCATCQIGPTTDNNNCLTCKDSKNLDLGNCVDTCTNGNFLDSDGIYKCKCSNIKCKYCSNESKQYGLCVSCNNEDGYYPKNDDEPRSDLFISCYNKETISKYYLNTDTGYLEKCYSTCEKCSELGDANNNKCTQCISTHEFKTDFENDYNCYEKCNKYYYFDSGKIHHCVNNCPNDYKYLIVSKNKCTNNCTNDDTFKYHFKNICYESCPSNTNPSNDNIFICEEKVEEEQCIMTQNELPESINEILVSDISSRTQIYAQNSVNINNYVSTYINKYISIYIYKNITCLQMKVSSAPQIDFGDCYNKVKNHYNFSDDLIISVININKDNSKPTTTYAFSNPITGELISSSEICSKEKIVVQEDVKTLIASIDDKKEEFIMFCAKQGIDVFNVSDEFYNDLCYHFESPNGRDIPMKDRYAMFYPNISLCDSGCENKGVDLETLKAKCECIFNDIMNQEILQDNLYGQQIEEIMDLLASLNVEVVKCIKDIFCLEYFIKCDGAFIFMGFFISQSACIIVFFIRKLVDLRKFFYTLNQSYFNYLTKNNLISRKKRNIGLISMPPRKKQKIGFANAFPNGPNAILSSQGNNSKTNLKNFKKLFENKNKRNSVSLFQHKLKEGKTPNKNKKSSGKKLETVTNLRRNANNKISANNDDLITNNNIATNEKLIAKNKLTKNSKLTASKNLISSKTLLSGRTSINKFVDNNDGEIYIESKDLIDIKEYLSMSFDENDFDDVMDKEERTYCAYFSEKFKENQIFINAFFMTEPLRPKSIKILVLIVTIELYFVVNALFYTEEYLSSLLEIEGKDSFFDFVPRRFNHFVYIVAVIGVITYLMGYFFVEEKKIKKMFIRNKEGETKLKIELSNILKDIKKRFTILVIICILFCIIGFIYISCFNNVYPNSKSEWIKSSLFIIILTQLMNFLLTFAESSIRYMAIKCNSEKLFKLSLILE